MISMVITNQLQFFLFKKKIKNKNFDIIILQKGIGLIKENCIL